MKLITTLFAALTLFSVAANAQQMRVATGGKGNTYSTMFGQLSKQCGNEVAMVELNTSGSNQNLDLLVGNEVNAAWVQTDVLFFRARTEDLGNVKTLMTMHPEEVHIVALNKARKEGGFGGFGGFGGKEVVLSTVSQLANLKVGAAGGSFTTAQVIRLQSEIPFNVVQFAGEAPMMEALTKGEIDAVIMVGGAPMGSIQKLTSAHKLLSVPDEVAKKLEGVYRKARVSYSNMGAAGVHTVATDAIFVTREYKTPRMQEALSKFRSCAFASLDEMKETTGTHPKWQAVRADNKGKWAYYELPVAAKPKK